MGDFYIPSIVLPMIPEHAKFSRRAVWLGYGLFAGSKVANCIARFVAYFLSMDESKFFPILSMIDAITCLVGIKN